MNATTDEKHASFESFLCVICRASKLPTGWATAVTKDGRVFFVNHIEKYTSWKHPITGEKWRSLAPFTSSSSHYASVSDRSASHSPVRRRTTSPPALDRISPVSWRMQKEAASSGRDTGDEQDSSTTSMAMHDRPKRRIRDGNGHPSRESRGTHGAVLAPDERREHSAFMAEESHGVVDLDRLLQEVVQGRLSSAGLPEQSSYAWTDHEAIPSVKSSPSMLDREHDVAELKEVFSKEKTARKKAEAALELEMRRWADGHVVEST
jgi:hypothetical protein